MKTLNEISAFLLTRRKDLELEQSDMYMRIGMKQQQYQRAETGHDMRLSSLLRILEGLDSSQEQLEKDAFDVINSSDTSLNLVKESISSVEEILKMITELNEIAEESAARIKELEKIIKKGE